MNGRCGAASSLAMILALSHLVPAGALAKGPPGGGAGGREEAAGKNLSFLVIAVDGLAITPIVATVFGVAYAGASPGLTAEEAAHLAATGPWCPQKTTANAWQSDYVRQSAVDVTWVDWGDSIESVSPRVGYPARLAVTLYRALATPMRAYTMAVLENPSSSTELRGTNTTTSESTYATITSGLPKLVVRHPGLVDRAALTWDGTRWVAGAVVPRVVPVVFAPELNVGGRYIFGASQGRCKPRALGT